MKLYKDVTDKYLPDRGEGDTKATQIVTAVVKLIYKWYNDGDVFDNQHHLRGWVNNLSSYANWLWANTSPEVAAILNGIENCYCAEDYEKLLTRLADTLLDMEYLDGEDQHKKVGTIYKCDGPFRFVW